MDRRVLIGMTVAALALPIAIVLVAAAARLLAAVGDPGGSLGLDRAAVVLAVVWGLDLILLVVGLAIGQSLTARPRDDEQDEF